jgi:protein SHQ1
VEIRVDDTLLTVHVNPYFLRLKFSHAVVEDDDSSAQYDAGSGYLTVTLTKETRGQEFTDLDLLAKLLAPRSSVPARPTIEVLSSEDSPQLSEDTLANRTAEMSLEEREILQGTSSVHNS